MAGFQQSDARSVPAGGPATINGILYQLLWSLLRATRVRIDAAFCDDSGNIETVFLTLEPVGGGDLVVSDEVERSVEQLKARPDGGTWSLREVVEGILPDLFRACPNAPERTRFRFITEGRMGRWEKVYHFFQSLKGRTCPPDNPISALDAVKKLPFGGCTQPGDDDAFWSEDFYTEASLFERIVAELRDRKLVPDDEDVTITQLKVWHLLANFEFVGGQDALKLQNEIDAHFLALADHHEQIPEMRDAMVLDLARRATVGNAVIDAHAFFRDHGVDSVPLSDWSRLRANSAKQVDTFLASRRYDADLDVRFSQAVSDLNNWPNSSPILAVCGESGQGKSWRAYAMALAARSLPQIVVTIDATGDARSTIQRAAETLWHEITGHDAFIPLSQIAERVRRVVGTRIQPWLLLVVDGVRETAEAKELVRQPWEKWGVRLLLTCPPRLTEQIEQESLGRCVILPIDDFDVDELHEYLSRSFGNDWPVIPDTIWSSLKRPLLANLFRQIASGQTLRMESEYELYEAFSKRLSVEAPLDGSALERLAQALLDGEDYPWSGKQMNDAAVDADSLQRIERAGWVRILLGPTRPCFEVPHDRLLNWLVAATLINSLRDKRESVQSIGDRLRDFLSNRSSVGNRYMGFVPMDFLWMAIHDNGLNDQVPAILAILEQFPVRTDSLYRKLIPTLGESAVPALISRLKDATSDGILCRQITDAIGLIGGVAPADAARELLMEDDPRLQRFAMRVLAQCPVPDVLDRLWELHLASQNTPDQYLREHEGKHVLYEESYGALRECCRVHPEWLHKAIQQCRTESEPIHTLAYLVAAVGDKGGNAIWKENKETFRQKVSEDKQRCFATCILRFADMDELDWLAQNVSNEKELVGPLALSALAQLAPALAIVRLDALPRKLLSSTRHWYVNHMFVHAPEAMQSKILSMIDASDDPWSTAAIYRGSEHFLDSTTLNLLLNDLEERLETVLTIQEWGRQESLYSEMQLLASLGTIDQLRDFENRKDSRLEALLTDFLMRIGPRRGVSQDSQVRDVALDVLYRMGGAGFTRVVNSYIEAESRFARLDGIRLAAKRPDEHTILLLSEITASDETWEGHYLEQCHAAESLADLGEWTPVLSLVERIGLKAFREITDLPRLGRRPPVELVQEMRDRVKVKQGNSQPGDVLALGIGGQTTDAEIIRSVLAICRPDGELAHACVISLELLEDKSHESVALLESQLKCNDFSATNALIENGTQDALQCLRRHAQGRLDVAISINLINRLSEIDEVLLEVRNALESELRRHSLIDFSVSLENLLHNINSPDHVAFLLKSNAIQTYIREASFASEGSGWYTGSKASAIRCLARFDAQAAFLAARTALRNVDWHERDYYPYILIELDRGRAIRLLLEQLAIENKSLVVRAICGALMSDGIDDVLSESLNSADTNERRVGCIAAGWVSQSAQTEIALRKLLSDPDEAVSRESADALSRIQRRNECRKLAEAMRQDTDHTRRWLLLDCLLSLADPGDKHRKWPIEGPSIGDVLSSLQVGYVIDSMEEMRKRLER